MGRWDGDGGRGGRVMWWVDGMVMEGGVGGIVMEGGVGSLVGGGGD